MLRFLQCAMVTGIAALVPVAALAWTAKQAPLMTKWASQVDPNNTLPEYPRPQLVRSDWINLNGIWQYQAGAANDPVPVGKDLPGEILVPFPIESALSGVMEHHDRLWYRRLFSVPTAWKNRHVALNFGAVDYESEVFINGKSIGIHHGGYDAFSYDITPQLNGDGPQELIVRVFDPTEDGGQPRGKQTTTPGGIMYTPTTGIWQTVWLEPVADISIQSLKIVPDVDRGRLLLTVNTSGPPKGVKVSVKIKDSGQVVQSFDGVSNLELSIPVPNPKLWSPQNPYLYDLDVSLAPGDEVTSYFGMRKVQLGDVNGMKQVFLNGKQIFLLGPLDQGFWPDGIYTAPTDEALKSDVEQIKAFGFNMVRKHIKVEPARWYYWTDKLGVLVWQDMPSANSYMGNHRPVQEETGEFEWELQRMIQTHWNSPSIFMWTLFNEHQGQFDTPRLVNVVKTLDPTRLVNEASGGERTGAGDFNDVHNYPSPSIGQRTTPQAYVCGEFGGIALKVDHHTWKNRGGGYISLPTSTDTLYLYADYLGEIKNLRDTKGLAGAVYTQLTDVENELNGLMTYDRIPKLDVAKVAKINRFEFAPPTYQPVAATSEGKSQSWKYTFSAPTNDWNAPGFDDSTWKVAGAPFGLHQKLGTTPWTTPEIWLRRHFNPGNLTADQINNLVIRELHSSDIQVYINGVHAFSHGSPDAGYENIGSTQDARSRIIQNGDNILAVHCMRRTGEQFVDVGLYVRISTNGD